MRFIDTRINLHCRPCPERILADCRNETEALQNLSRLAALDAVSDGSQRLHLVMMEEHVHRFADMLFLPT